MNNTFGPTGSRGYTWGIPLNFLTLKLTVETPPTKPKSSKKNLKKNKSKNQIQNRHKSKNQKKKHKNKKKNKWNPVLQKLQFSLTKKQKKTKNNFKKKNKNKKNKWNPVPGWAPQKTCPESKNCNFPSLKNKKKQIKTKKNNGTQSLDGLPRKHVRNPKIAIFPH